MGKYIYTTQNSYAFFILNGIKTEINFIDDIMNNEGNFKSGEEIFMQLEGGRRWKDILSTGNKTMKVKKEVRPYTAVNNRQVFILPKKQKSCINF